MYLADYHIHSQYSFDGKETIGSICKTAMERGMDEIAITDHLDLYSDRPYREMLSIDSVREDISNVQEEFKGKLIIRHGVELGQPQINPEEAKKFYKENSLDFIIGSIHNLENDFDLYYYDFRATDCVTMYDHYLDWLMDLAKNYEYDVLGHITYPLRYAAKNDIYLDVTKYKEKFVALFEILVKRGKGIEVNTSGLIQKMKDTMPQLSILQLYKECGGEIITIGTDSHRLEHVGWTIKEGQDVIKQAGFKSITTYQKRQPIFRAI